MPIEKSTTQEGPVWDPVAQIYVGGEVPGATNAEVQEMIEQNEGKMPVFGYGSLCWKPGGVLAHENVTSRLGKALSYRRCWAQKSTDHRGEPRFPGIVCTLLKEEEFHQIRGTQMEPSSKPGFTEGVLYVVPPDLVEECLEELDFREKGGYAREIVEVVEDASGRTVRALLYRGTPDNPAIWPRALRDLQYAAAVLSVATGPSGKNDLYLNNLSLFLENATNVSSIQNFDDTVELARRAKAFQSMDLDLFFLFGAGSNQHNQLLLESENNVAMLENHGEDAHNLKEILLCAAPEDLQETGMPKEVLAGGGHSGLLTTKGKLFLFGWNERGQLGQCRQNLSMNGAPSFSPLPNLAVEKCFMGHHHTIAIEMGTQQLWAFGDNSRGQVNGQEGSDVVKEALRPKFLLNDRVIDASCGLFHSAAVTQEGELVIFGCGRFGQSLDTKVSKNVWVSRWKPDSAKVVKVACGRRHTIFLDEHGKLYSIGDNKYGQLGRILDPEEKTGSTPQRIEGPWEDASYVVHHIECGWSHSVIRVTKTASGGQNEKPMFYGWGRNDKGQLGLGHDSSKAFTEPTRLFENHPLPILEVRCGSEFTIAISENDEVWSTGWNEHGNLALNNDHDASELTKITGATVTNPPGNPVDARLCVAAGGGHILLGRVS